MHRFGNRHYLFGFVAATAIMLLIGFSIMVATQRFSDAVSRVESSLARIGLLAHVRAHLHDAIATQRSYLLTSDPTLLREYRAFRPTLQGEVSRLSAMIAGDASQSRDGEQLGPLIESRLDAADEGIRILEARGLAAVQAHLRGNRGRRIMQRIETVSAGIESRERTELRRHGDAAAHAASLLFALGVLGIPLSLALVWWVFALLSREVHQREDAEARLGASNDQLLAGVAELERVGSDLTELGRYARHLQGCRTIGEAMDATRQAMLTLLPGCAGTVYLLRASGDHAEAAVQWGEPAARHKPRLQPPDCWSLRRSNVHLVDDLRRGTACTHFELPPEVQPVATACFPLGAQNLLLGVMSLSQRQAGPIARVEIAATAAEQLSLALGNLHLQESLRQQSIRDPLTGLYNRRYLEESLPRELSRCERTGRPLAVMMLDLDHFKSLNDRHGHDAGDRMLAAFGELLQSLCRREDIACRYGGEEFTLILPELDCDTALRRANEIREATAHMVVGDDHQRVGPVTVSIGLAMFPEHGSDGSSLREAADVALYRAKHGGRNRVEIA